MHLIKYEMGFPCGSAGKESACNAGDLGSIPLCWEDPLEKGKATHSSVLPGEFTGLYSLWGCKEMKYQILPDEIPAQLIVGSLQVRP